jgi:GntR family transcriptional repressor for pyruvate dehydrogenase complex
MEWRLITEKHDIVNLLEVRIALEGLSAANAAVNSTDEDIDALRKLLAKMKACGKDEAQFAILDAEFHVTIANASGNTVISDLVSVIRSQLVRALTKVLQSPNAIPLSIKEHLSLVDAIAAHDPDAAREVMLDHLKAALHRYTLSSGAAKSGRSRTPKVPAAKSAKNGHSIQRVN